jgi:hypothetical protein
MENLTNPTNNSLRSIDISDSSMPTSRLVGIFFACIVMGIVTGTVLAFAKNSLSKRGVMRTGKGLTNMKTEGIKDEKTFKDSATGVLQEGGFEGEGSFHLERAGGDSQNVYLTSSAVDLSLYVGKKVTVKGETFAAEKAGWLMDVGLVEVLK